uniref:Ig-like domain-containing protein n=1 Tax=Castor canadensis TaxID=51338 RepID=A0A8C0WNL2_CASCN
MIYLWLSRDHCMADLTVILMVFCLSLPVTVPVSTACFLEQVKHERYFSNGMKRVRGRYLVRYVRFDSDLGQYKVVTKLGRADAEYWNSQKDCLAQKRAAVDRFCRYNHRIGESFTVQRRGEPVCVSLQHHNILVCSVSRFYPGHIEVTWFWNGQEEEAGVVSTGLLQNGDWTFQTLVMLETVPQNGEVYTCQVEHPSLMNAVTIEWSE